LEQPESLTCTDTPLTLVASHELLLVASKLLLQEYAPTYSALIAPPYEFAPKDTLSERLTALQLEQPESLTCTDTPRTLVASHVLLLLAVLLTLQEYAPTNSALIAPPYEFAPRDTSRELLTALQLEQPESLTCTDTPFTLVASHLLLLAAPILLLQEYAPTYNTLIAPPYEFAPRDCAMLEFESKLTCVKAVQSTDAACRTRTSTPITSVAPHVLLLLLASLRLQA
jgi:hypothetical protein